MLVRFAEQIQQAPPGALWAWGIVASLCGLLALWAAFHKLARARFLEDTPTSPIRSAAQGYVELEGNTRLLPGPEIVSPLSRQRCVWWSYEIEEKQTVGSGDSRRREWVTIDEGRSDELFLLADRGGECIVDPVGASVHPGLSRRWQGYSERPHLIPASTPWISFGAYRYSEQLLRVGDFLYATGWFRTQNAIQEYNESRDVSELLAEWKRDRGELLHRFDTDRNGVIDAQEWETARLEALEAVRARHVDASAHPDIDVLCKPPDRRPFLLSSLTQKELSRRYRLWASIFLVLAGGIGAGLVWTLQLRGIL